MSFVRLFAPTLSVVLLGALLTLPAPVSAQEIDLTGEWVLTVESPNGTGTRQVTFEQDGTELRGTISSSMATGPLEGTVEGDQVHFVAVVAMDTGDFEVTYDARIEDGRLVDGTVDFGDYGFGTFTGRRKDG